ncbi:ATP/GTP-binding protein [Streptomyces virginiae]|uniref:ATP/GTP-binding protein n=1 Tax=Streptomyces virginiae TaxID=1961 RepID=UPI00365B67BC
MARDGSGGTFEVPCYDEHSGWFDASSSCYWQLLIPQPPAEDPVWSGRTPGDGAVYNGQCPGQPLAGGFRWFQNPPAGFGGGPNLEALAQEAVTKMRLLGADIGIAPKQGGTGTVGVPVWVWNGPSPQTTGPTSASATALGVTVTATATVQDVVWNFGNDTSVSCPFPGTPYSPAFGLTPPSKAGGQCGIAGYARVGEYTVAATTTWAVHWVGGGQQGDLTTTRSSQAAVRIGELQVVGQ